MTNLRQLRENPSKREGRVCALVFPLTDSFGPRHLPITPFRYYLMINGIFWNIRGVAKAPNLRRLIKLVKSHQAKFVAICEPKLDVSRIESIRLRLNFDFVLVNCSGDIWVFYNSPFVCSKVGNSCKHLSLFVQSPLMPGSIIMSFVHAKCSVEERRELWSNLVADKPSSLQ